MCGGSRLGSYPASIEARGGPAYARRKGVGARRREARLRPRSPAPHDPPTRAGRSPAPASPGPAPAPPPGKPAGQRPPAAWPGRAAPSQLRVRFSGATRPRRVSCKSPKASRVDLSRGGLGQAACAGSRHAGRAVKRTVCSALGRVRALRMTPLAPGCQFHPIGRSGQAGNGQTAPNLNWQLPFRSEGAPARALNPPAARDSAKNVFCAGRPGSHARPRLAGAAPTRRRRRPRCCRLSHVCACCRAASRPACGLRRSGLRRSGLPAAPHH